MKALKCLGVSFLIMIFLTCAQFTLAEDRVSTVLPVDISGDGDYVLVSNQFYHGLSLLNNHTGQTEIITVGRNAGYYATISDNLRYICFKAFQEENGRFLQKPMLYDLKSKSKISLTEWSPLAGTPTVAPNGQIAYTVGDELFVVDANFNLIFKLDLGYHVNLLDFSSDSQKLVFNDLEGQIVILDLFAEAMQIIEDINSFWGPKFSPDSDLLAASTIDGQIALFDLGKSKLKTMIKGEFLGWVNNDTIACLEKVISQREVKQSNLILLKAADLSKKIIEISAGDAVISLKGKNISLARNNQLELGHIYDQRLNLWPNKIKISLPLTEMNNPEQNSEYFNRQDVSIRGIYDGVYSRYLTGLPYIHQVYDTPNNFNGHWACGATSALMAIQYYGVLSAHPITVDVPYSHTSNYGWYVSNQYTYGRTFDIYGQDPNGNWFAGGYGYIIQDDWADTKGHMAEYIQHHNRGSSVDWSPTWSEIKTEIDNNHPFVVLTSLTSAGHYITARGYYWDQYTVVFNDPYGNKNNGYMNYSGSLVSYDWPGYNNGYSNLNTVHCFIYCR